MMTEKTNEVMFQNDMARQLIANGWLLGKPENYNRDWRYTPKTCSAFLKPFNKDWLRMIQVRQIPENTRGISRHGLSFISLFLPHSNSCQGNRLIIMNYLISSQPEDGVLSV